MTDKKIPLIKSYPNPDPDVAGAKSAFSRFDKSGKHYYAILEPDCPVAEFVLSTNEDGEKKGEFKVKTDKNGDIITKKHKRMAPYIPGDDLIELVRLAQLLQRPVLIKGEPGSGKTQLAKSVAFEWYREQYQQHFFEWHIKSTSKVADGLYTFDYIKRLRDANDNSVDKDELNNNDRYRVLGPMGQAFLTSTRDNPSILLIDEIDKADIDFPNDLLLELDERRFKIPDTNESFEAEYPPVVFITSNDERELPEAFLRRCLFLYIKFPEEEHLKAIIRAHLPNLMEEQDKFTQQASIEAVKLVTKIDPASNDPDGDLKKQQEKLISFVDFAIQRFNELRIAISNNPADNKRISTSELLDWLRGYEFDLVHSKEAKTPENVKAWTALHAKAQQEGITSELIEKGLQTLPFYHHALLKTYAAAKNENKIND